MDSFEDLADRLGKVSHFRSISLKDRLAIVFTGQIRVYPADTDILLEGDPCSGMFVLLKGHVHIIKHGLKGQCSIIAEIDPVIMFNEVALLDGGPNPYTVHAAQNCLCWHIEHSVYKKMLVRLSEDKYLQVALGLLKVMALRQRQLLENYADLTFLSVPKRVAKLICELSDHGTKTIDRSEISIDEMAAHIGTSPEAISRCLKDLRLDGVILSTRKMIRVLQPDELARIALSELTNPFAYKNN